MSSSREAWWMRWSGPCEDWGREWLEWVDEEETELEREWMGRKSSEDGIICMLSAVMSNECSGPAPKKKSREEEEEREWVRLVEKCAGTRCTQALQFEQMAVEREA